MATRRRDVFPGKERATPSPQTGASKLRGAINQISKPKVSTAQPAKVTKPASKTPTTIDVSKPQTRRPATSTTAIKPTQTRSRSLNNKTATPTPTPTPKVRVSTTATATAAAPRSSSLPVRTVASPKPAPVKTWKPVAKEEGKRRLSNASIGSGRRSSTGCKKESGNSVSATKEHKQNNHFNLDKNEDLSMYYVPEPEMKIQDIEYSYLAEAEEKTVQSLSDFEKFEKGIDGVVREDQELLSSTKIEDMINHADPMVVTGESTTVLEHQEAPVDIKQGSEKKQELEHDMNETNNKVEKTADNFHEEAKEKEVKMVEVAEEERAAVVSNADESKKIENPAVEKKQEQSVAQKLQEKMQGKYDSPVSNDVIEETASKLREMRKNKVRALAGAFESVISSQEK